MSAFVDGLVNFLQLHLSVVGCRRRNPSRDQILRVSSEHVGKFSKPKSAIPAQAFYGSKKQICRDRTNDSTDGSDLAALSTDGSDLDTSTSQTPSDDSQRTYSPPSSTSARFAKAPQRKVQGFTSPPGLPAPNSWNARPKPVNQTLRPCQGNPPATMDAIKREMLNDVMGKLNSEDADILKALFNARQPTAQSTAGAGLARSGFHDPRQWHSRVQPSRDARCYQNSSSAGGESLRENLRRMATMDEKRIVFVKRIAKLGLGSSQALKLYFSRFGPVEEVLCTHAIDKRTDSSKPRARPANTGFVIFKKVEDAAAAIRTGSDQVVSGLSVSVGTYEHHVPKEPRGSNGGVQQVSECQRW